MILYLKAPKQDFYMEKKILKEISLKKLRVGDMFNATAESGASAICLVLDVRDGIVYSRSVTTHRYYDFSITTGIDPTENKTHSYQVDCVEEMSPDAKAVFLEIDWKFNPKNPVRNPALTREQRLTFIYASIHAELFGNYRSELNDEL